MKSPLAATVFIALLGGAAAQAQTGDRVISGFVASADGQPVASATVTLSDTNHPGHPAETTTDAEGRFDFTNLPDGRFNLIASRRGYASSAYDEHGGVNTAIVTGENLLTTGIVITLAPLASIFGTVTEDSGDPVPRAQLHLYRDDPMRHGSKQRPTQANADEMGNFEISQVRPGDYFLCATGVPWYRPNGGNPGNTADQARSPLDVAYPLSCYPDTADSAGAEPITIKAGAHLEVNVLMHAVPAIHISIQVPRPEPNQGIQFPQLTQEIFGSKEFVFGAPSFGNLHGAPDSGTFAVTLSGLAPGQYEIKFSDGGQNSGPARIGAIRVSSGDATVDMSSLQSAASISGKVLMEDSGNPPESASISLIGDELDPVSGGQIQADGSFQLNNVPPGTYEPRVNGSHGQLTVNKLKINGVASRGTTVHVGSDPIELTIIAIAPVTSVTGSVGRNGKPTSGVFVLLVPEDLHAGMGSWIVNQSDSDGSFLCNRVPPGRYTAVAIEQGWKLDWRRPEVISPYLARGVAITIVSGSRSAALSSTLEAQPSDAPPTQ
jgi:hypothetical protein